eukprot:1148252-Pelagomonas_calceolata.AAC.1
MDIIRTAIIPSIASAFPVTPCFENDLACWDRLALNIIEERYKLWQCTATAILQEDKINIGLGCTSIAVGYNVRCATATPLASITLADTAGSPSQYWNLKSTN